MCIFCERGDGFYVAYENEKWWINIDTYPVSPGHIEIIPKLHIESIQDLSQAMRSEMQEMMTIGFGIIETLDWKEQYTHILKTTSNEKMKEYMRIMLDHSGLMVRPDGYNTGNNDGAAAGRTVHHFHFHIIPRYDSDVDDPRGGIRMVIPELCNYKK